MRELLEFATIVADIADPERKRLGHVSLSVDGAPAYQADSTLFQSIPVREYSDEETRALIDKYSIEGLDGFEDDREML